MPVPNAKPDTVVADAVSDVPSQLAQDAATIDGGAAGKAEVGSADCPLPMTTQNVAALCGVVDSLPQPVSLFEVSLAKVLPNRYYGPTAVLLDKGRLITAGFAQLGPDQDNAVVLVPVEATGTVGAPRLVTGWPRWFPPLRPLKIVARPAGGYFMLGRASTASPTVSLTQIDADLQTVAINWEALPENCYPVDLASAASSVTLLAWCGNDAGLFDVLADGGVVKIGEAKGQLPVALSNSGDGAWTLQYDSDSLAKTKQVVLRLVVVKPFRNGVASTFVANVDLRGPDFRKPVVGTPIGKNCVGLYLESSTGESTVLAASAAGQVLWQRGLTTKFLSNSEPENAGPLPQVMVAAGTRGIALAGAAPKSSYAKSLTGTFLLHVSHAGHVQWIRNHKDATWDYQQDVDGRLLWTGAGFVTVESSLVRSVDGFGHGVQSACASKEFACTDGKECTVDDCDPAAGCTHGPLQATSWCAPCCPACK